MNLMQIKLRLRAGKYAWPGGYPLYFITGDGAVLSFEAVRAEWRSIVDVHLHHDKRSGWYILDCDVNWEDTDLRCAHTNALIESAY